MRSRPVDDLDQRRWYAVQTQPHAEPRAVAHLERQALTAFCPLAVRTVRHARRVTRSRAPLFPGYLFVLLDLARDRWRSVNGTRGVIRLLAQGDTPVPVPEGVVESLRARVDGEGVIDWTPSLACGQSVRICDGPFADLIGRIEHLDGAGRVRVLIELMGRAVSVEARPGMLAPAD
jgi:transcription elongation factor/antiterminator RfaH